MNKKKVAESVSSESGLPVEMCETALRAFEKQCEIALSEKFRGIRNNRTTMLLGITRKTGFESEDCDRILCAIEKTLGQGLAAQLKFGD